MFDRTFSGADLARRQRGLTLKGGGGWRVDLTLRKKTRTIMDSNGGLATPLTPSRSATDFRKNTYYIFKLALH